VTIVAPSCAVPSSRSRDAQKPATAGGNFTTTSNVSSTSHGLDCLDFHKTDRQTMVAPEAVPMTAIEMETDAGSSTPVRGRAASGWRSCSRVTAFPLEWLGVAALVLIDTAWAARIGFSLSVSRLDFAVPLLALAAIIMFRTIVRREQGWLTAEYFLLSGAAMAAFGVLSYLCAAASYPLVDDELLRLDRAMGFDRQHWFRLVQDRPAVIEVLRFAYDSLVYQCLYFTILFGLLRRKAELREMFWIVFIAGLLTSAGSMFFPAFSAFETIDLKTLGEYLPDLKHLRSGANLNFAFGELTGIITFPSFHTTMALVYIYAFRRTGPIGYLILAINLAMLLSIPYFGGHYLVDMIAGAGLALAAILLARKLPDLERHAAKFFVPAVGRLAQSPG
jgi:membrane-associated phospholipid phosphatase